MEPHFSVCFEGRLAKELEHSGIVPHRLGAAAVRNPLSIVRARRKLRSLFTSTRFDAAICHQSWTMALFGQVALAHGVPLVFWAHGGITGEHWLERWSSRTVPDLAIANSRFTASTVPKIYPHVPVNVLYCPVPSECLQADTRKEVRESLDTRKDDLVIVQVSRMEPWKGQTVLLESLARVKDLSGWVCWIVGGAQRPKELEYARKLEVLAHRLGIFHRVRFAGARSDVPQLLSAADIYCQPNVEPEPFGISIVEALYAGLPVVTSNFGGGAEIVDGTCGLLAEPGSPDSVARALRSLLESPALRRKLGSSAQHRARAVSDPARQLPMLRDLLASAAAKHRAQGKRVCA